MKIIELKINDDIANNMPSLEAISLVEKPAIEIDFMAFSKGGQKPKKIYFSAEEKQMIYGPALVPEKLILRKDDDGEYYSVYFSKDTVAKCANIYMQKNFNSFTVDHENLIKNVNIVENWIVEDPKNDKANVMGFDVKAGTWMVGAKIENKQIWSKIKAGELKGFSIEGYFSEAFSKVALKSEITDEYILSSLNEIESEPDNEKAKIKLLELYNLLKK